MKRIRIETAGGDGEWPLSRNAQVLDASGNQIHGITAIDVQFRIDDLVRAKIELFSADLRTEAMAQFVIKDPTDGKTKAIRRIEFDDGTAVDL